MDFFKKFFYDSNRYSDTFLERYPKQDQIVTTYAEEVVYGFWTGTNAITPNRQKCIESIKKKCGVRFQLVTPDNLSQFIVKEHPLHSSYDNLSLNHKSDYLRCYFMHYHGGGYIDIKMIDKSWESSFKKLNRRCDKWIIGYPELAPSGISQQKGMLESDLRRNYFRLIGNGGFICKPKTPFTNEWLKLVEDYLSDNKDELEKNPGNIFGTNEGYPLSWAGVQGAIFQPLCLKYHDVILQNSDLQMSFENYR